MNVTVNALDIEGMFRAIVGFSPAELHQRLGDAARLVRDQWATFAAAKLSTPTAQRYDSALAVVEVGAGHWAVVLTDRFANLLEHGTPPWDLRLTVLRSPKAKTSKAGNKYMSIPFFHATPGSAGRTGAPMPPHIHRQAKELRGTVSGADAQALIANVASMDPEAAAFHQQRLAQSTRNTLWGGIAGTEPGLGRLPAGLAPKAHDYHATDKYAGMVRMAKQYQAKKDSTFMTFRTISTNPASLRDEDGRNPAQTGKATRNWMHPGFPGLHLVREAAQFADTVAIPGALGAP
jgi:hypothetical protein